MSANVEAMAETSLALSHFAASSTAVLIAALHRGKPVDDQMVQHLLKTLAKGRASAPTAAAGYFDAIADTLSGKHYEGG